MRQLWEQQRQSADSVLAAGSIQALELAQFTAYWEAALDPEGRSGHARSAGSVPKSELASPAPFPEVPGDDFPLFRAACRRLLDEASFAQVDLLYQHCHDAANVWLSAHLQRTPRPSAEELRAAWSDETELRRCFVGHHAHRHWSPRSARSCSSSP